MCKYERKASCPINYNMCVMAAPLADIHKLYKILINSDRCNFYKYNFHKLFNIIYYLEMIITKN